jgi:hypothetical protein
MHPAAQGRIPAAEIDARTRIILEAPLLRTIIRLAVPNAAVMVTQVSLGSIELYFLAKLGVDALLDFRQPAEGVGCLGWEPAPPRRIGRPRIRRIQQATNEVIPHGRSRRAA